MFGSESDFVEQSGLLRSGKRYKRNFASYTLVQNTEYSAVSLADSEPEETPSVGNPPVTPQRRSVIPKNPSQSASNPSPSIPVAGQSTPVSSHPPKSSPPPNPLDPLWPTCMMTLSYLFSKELDQRIHNSFGFYVK